MNTDDSTSALGAPIGGPDAIRNAMESSLTNAETTRGKIALVSHAPTEMVLTRLCADVAKVQYNLRLNGVSICSAQLDSHDRSLRNGLTAILGSDVQEAPWTQATTGVRK